MVVKSQNSKILETCWFRAWTFAWAMTGMPWTCLPFLETGPQYVNLTGLELTVFTRLTSSKVSTHFLTEPFNEKLNFPRLKASHYSNFPHPTVSPSPCPFSFCPCTSPFSFFLFYLFTPPPYLPFSLSTFKNAGIQIYHTEHFLNHPAVVFVKTVDCLLLEFYHQNGEEKFWEKKKK